MNSLLEWKRRKCNHAIEKRYKKGGSYIPHETFTIVKLDWDGNVIGHYSFDEEIGFFCVNEKTSDLYIIVHTIEGMNEYYDLKKYKI